MIVLYEYHRQSCGAQRPVIVGFAEKSALIAMNSRDDELDFGQLQRLYFQMRFLMAGLDAAPRQQSGTSANCRQGAPRGRSTLDSPHLPNESHIALDRSSPTTKSGVSRYFTCRAGVADRCDLTWFVRG